MRVEHSITIAVITFKRPESLKRTLESLAALVLPAAEVKLLVVDNDAAQSARATVEAARMPFPVSYCVEERQGIPHARNKALELAADSDYLAFIDDDDMADAGWLAALYGMATLTQADAVKGRVEYGFPEGKSYLGALDIFANPATPSGGELDSAWTNNVLLATRLYTKTGLRFDVDFLESGGSDSHFFRCAHRNGAKIVMCQEAVVRSLVADSRTGWKWLGRRAMRIGATMSMSEQKTGGARYGARRAARSLADSALYCARLLRGVCRGRTPAIHPALVLCFMAGRVMGVCRMSPREYKKPS